jgi:hypothetical protein
MKAATATKRSTVIGSMPPSSPPVLEKALCLHCPIASNSNLATYLDHLVMRQFENICNTNGVACHRTPVALARNNGFVTYVKSNIIAVHFEFGSRRAQLIHLAVP